MKRSPLPFLLFLTLTHLFYFPTWNAGFVTDYTGLAERIESSQFLDFLNTFGFPSLWPVLSFFHYLFYYGFGVTGIGWYLTFTLLHAGNGYLLYRLLRSLGHRFMVKQSGFIALFGALFFLLSPYQTEVVVWRVCLNFLLSTALILGTALLTLRWLQNRQNRLLIGILALMWTGLLTFELAVIIPLVSALLLLVEGGEKQAGSGKAWLQLALPQFGSLCFFFLLHRIFLGSWIGHYGAAVHLKFDLPQMLGHVFRYVFKLTSFTRYYDHGLKERIAQAFDQSVILYPAVLVGLGALAAGAIYWRKLSPRMRLSWFLTMLFGFALAPVINLYFNYLLHIENDRYGYLASAFLLPVVAIGFSFLPRYFRYGVAIVYLGISGYFLWKTAGYWHDSTKVGNGLIAGFDAYEADTVYLLNLPDNLQGAPMFRDYTGTAETFADALLYLRRAPYRGNFMLVAQYNMTDADDGVSVSRDSSGYKVTFDQYGNWWWRRGLGLGDYETEEYIFKNRGQDYHLEMKNSDLKEVMLYQGGVAWKRW